MSFTLELRSIERRPFPSSSNMAYMSAALLGSWRPDFCECLCKMLGLAGQRSRAEPQLPSLKHTICKGSNLRWATAWHRPGTTVRPLSNVESDRTVNLEYIYFIWIQMSKRLIVWSVRKYIWQFTSFFLFFVRQIKNIYIIKKHITLHKRDLE